MMTSFAFILGVVPLMVSAGAGAEMRQTLGTAVFSGMLGVTLFGIFLTPVFYYVIQWFSDRRAAARPQDDEDEAESEKPHDGHPGHDGHPSPEFALTADGHGNGAGHGKGHGHGVAHRETTTHAGH